MFPSPYFMDTVALMNVAPVAPLSSVLRNVLNFSVISFMKAAIRSDVRRDVKCARLGWWRYAAATFLT